ncbi:MAG: ribosomal protein S18-alanine N-acetyltransferase [Agathobacter sp.]|nr:ribosomal protein S18-alanine N-acetyltransferase [Agathobacter sp.]
MLIREMTFTDITQAVEIENQCFSTPWSEKSFQDSLTREDTLFLVCEEQDTITGYIGMYISFEEGSITNVAVSPIFRQKGYGEALVFATKERAKEKQIEKIFLEVRVSNVPAISLYKKMGFENLGKRKNFYDHPREDAYIMSCDLID